MPNELVYAFTIRTYFDVTSGSNFDREDVHEDSIFGPQNILQFYSG